jgi:predicted mannosyl-3-phosphoglycerate phosphatase (HAD superfamily)
VKQEFSDKLDKQKPQVVGLERKINQLQEKLKSQEKVCKMKSQEKVNQEEVSRATGVPTPDNDFVQMPESPDKMGQGSWNREDTRTQRQFDGGVVLLLGSNGLKAGGRAI